MRGCVDARVHWETLVKSTHGVRDGYVAYRAGRKSTCRNAIIPVGASHAQGHTLLINHITHFYASRSRSQSCDAIHFSLLAEGRKPRTLSLSGMFSIL